MALSPRFPISALGELVRQAHACGVKDVKDIRCRIDVEIESFMRRRITNLFREVLLELYAFDSERLKIDMARQMMLKGTIELTKQEQKHCLRFIWQHLSKYIDDNASFLKDL